MSVAEHGTTTAYKYGCRCDACRKASTNYKRRYRTSQGGGDKVRAQNRAERRAERRLRRMFPVEFATLLDEERAKEPLLNEPYRKGVTSV
jgi:hypothetical protein